MAIWTQAKKDALIDRAHEMEITLDGKPAMLQGRLESFPMVCQYPRGLRVE